VGGGSRDFSSSAQRGLGAVVWQGGGAVGSPPQREEEDGAQQHLHVRKKVEAGVTQSA
jgi:hypothetical protein